MPLLMIDLDNTLVDRDAAFQKAASAFLAAHALPGTDLDWLMTCDASGYTPREDVARAVVERYGLPAGRVRQFLDSGAVEHVTLPAETREALTGAREAGWSCVIVTNGRTAKQELKIRRTGLDRLVHAWVVSEAAGHKKPAPEIFHLAASAAGTGLDGAWMIGDSAHADVRGALGVGARSVWVSAGRTWAETTYRPTLIARDTPSAITLATSGGPNY
ncbi:HAD-IA family hydrolase [Streptomyces sp. S.PB5]|uniref:HAD family hydrolase n=1 Tax=Streptomyces sp. S.PB5 TaxID=3020844 RepID=UPI0025B09A7E|nr:HAD-IA family hydrolase [Streptomyces sp. S.PB5]MDN3025055.1 HAD-IA family hydrolase [Streptomyces sp. S.PB5]